MTYLPLECETVWIGVVVFPNKKNVEEYVHGYDPNWDQKGFEEALDPNPDDGKSSFFVGLLHLLNGSQNFAGRFQVLVETAHQFFLSTISEVELDLHSKKYDLGNLQGIFVLEDEREKCISVRISTVKNSVHVKCFVINWEQSEH